VREASVTNRGKYAMRAARQSHPISHEPIGIVIADGGAPSLAPRFSAYVWGPVPEPDDAAPPAGEASTLALAAAGR
jgi:hypothetical protein